MKNRTSELQRLGDKIEKLRVADKRAAKSRQTAKRREEIATADKVLLITSPDGRVVMELSRA